MTPEEAASANADTLIEILHNLNYTPPQMLAVLALTQARLIAKTALQPKTARDETVKALDTFLVAEGPQATAPDIPKLTGPGGSA